MIKVADIANAIENVAPLHLQEDYDNAGLITGDFDATCTGVLCTLDTTEAVVEEAVARNCNLILAHHPILFRPIRHLRPSDYVKRTLIRALKNDIAIYAAHTNLDNVPEGVNGRIADKLGLADREVLSATSPGIGSGLIGQLPKPLTKQDFLSIIHREFGAGFVRHNNAAVEQVARVALCGGSGSFLTSKALASKADAFITGDLKYHEFFDAEGRMLLCDIGHFESEQFTVDLFIDILLRKFRNFAVLKSEIITNPVHYFTGK